MIKRKPITTKITNKDHTVALKVEKNHPSKTGRRPSGGSMPSVCMH